jgi:hypothetical protein
MQAEVISSLRAVSLILDVSAALLLEAPQQTASVRRAANTDPVDLFVDEVGSGDNDRVIWFIRDLSRKEDNARVIFDRNDRVKRVVVKLF